jgi:hypothetical protein
MFAPINATYTRANAASATTAGITTTSGNLLVVCVTSWNNTLGTLSTTVSDNKGNTWSVAVAPVGSGQGWAGIAYCANCTGGSGHTFTITPTSNDLVCIAVLEISGAKTTSVLGNTNSATASTATHSSGSITSGTVDTVNVGVCAVSHGGEGVPVLTSPGTGWFLPVSLDGSALEGISFGFAFVGSGVSDSFDVTMTGTFTEGIAIAGFESAASGSPPGSGGPSAHTFA